MKIPYGAGRFLLNALLILNIAAAVIVEWRYRGCFTLKFVVWSTLVAHLVIRWPEIFYWWDKGHRRKKGPSTARPAGK